MSLTTDKHTSVNFLMPFSFKLKLSITYFRIELSPAFPLHRFNDITPDFVRYLHVNLRWQVNEVPSKAKGLPPSSAHLISRCFTLCVT